MPLMPSLLLGLVGISIPVLIHLLHRQKTQPVQWGAMQFLRVSPLQFKQKKKVEHWLLMAMRMLAIGVLALLLARPSLPQSRFIPRAWTDAPIDVAVIVDHSLSTGRMAQRDTPQTGGGNGPASETLFDRAVASTNALVDQLKPTDTISVILAEHNARPLNAQPIKKSNAGSIEQLRSKLAEEKQGMTDCSIPEAISAARKLLATGRNANKTIVILSDQQRSNWHIKDDALWHAATGEHRPGLTTSIHSLPISADAQLSNLSVATPTIEPLIVGIGRPLQIRTEISNTGSQPMPAQTARFIVNGKELQTKQVPALAAKSSATVRFDLDTGLSQSGSNWLKVAISTTDGLAADNQAYAAVNVVQHIPVLLIDGQLTDAGSFKSSRFLQAALQPQEQSLVQASQVSVSQALTTKLDDFTAVVVNDLPLLPASLRDKLVDYARTGHGVWIVLGPRTQKNIIEKEMNGLFSAQARELMNSNAAPSGLEIKDPTNPVVRAVTGDQHNALTGAVTRQWWALKPADAQIILSATNGDPLVLERSIGSSGGLICVWTSSVDGSFNNWNLMPNFVPLVNETIFHLSEASMHGLENQGIEAGQPIEWAGSGKSAIKTVEITLPDGTKVTRPTTYNHGRNLLTFADTPLPGIYKLDFHSAQTPPVYYGVNIDHTELDPTALDPDDINRLKSTHCLDAAQPVITADDLPGILRRKGKPPEMWGLLAAVLLAGLLFETFLTYRLVDSQKRVDVSNAGLTGYHAAI